MKRWQIIELLESTLRDIKKLDERGATHIEDWKDLAVLIEDLLVYANDLMDAHDAESDAVDLNCSQKQDQEMGI